MDTEVLTASYPTDEQISNCVMDANEDQRSDNDCENEEVIQSKPKRTEMKQSFETIRRGFQMEENVPDSIFNLPLKCDFF